ncbi:MAG: phosphate/phosphite/phosphonate ABC transporter substrate-binding protein [Gammaproteobacteria bacterium]|nr:phosphate/phosphite/phosphonate ABC transporter substrate-binding protein [Gammaproteobacteria bacterium]
MSRGFSSVVSHFRFALLPRLLLLIWLGGISLPILQAAENASLTLAIHPYLPADELLQKFTPLAQLLSQGMETPVSVRVGSSYDEHSAAIGGDRVDIAYMGPAPYIRMVDAYGYKPLLTRLEVNGRPTFQGHIIVREDSYLQSLRDLRGKSIAFGDHRSTMSYLIPYQMMLEAGVFPPGQHHSYLTLNGHVNIALGVLTGDVDAGAVKEEVYERYREEGIRSLLSTPAISEHLFVARSDLAPALQQKLKEVMLTLNETVAGREALAKIKPGTTRLVEVADSDYDTLRRYSRLGANE